MREVVEEYAPGNEDYDYDERVQEIIDDEDEARAEHEERERLRAMRRASGVSLEELFESEGKP